MKEEAAVNETLSKVQECKGSHPNMMYFMSSLCANSGFIQRQAATPTLQTTARRGDFPSSFLHGEVFMNAAENLCRSATPLKPRGAILAAICGFRERKQVIMHFQSCRLFSYRTLLDDLGSREVEMCISPVCAHFKSKLTDLMTAAPFPGRQTTKAVLNNRQAIRNLQIVMVATSPGNLPR